MSASPFAGRTALVTGGGSGIGRAAALRFAQEGAAVVVADLNDDTARQTAALITAGGGRAHPVCADVAKEADNAAMFDAADAVFGGLDLAFLNAGMLQPYMPLEEVSIDLFDRIIAVNLRGAFLGVRQAVTRLRPGGACVVTSSTAGLLGFAESAAYSTSKHGLIGLVRSSAAAFASRDLRINAICPGFVLTPMNGLPDGDQVTPPDALANPDYRGGLSGQQVAEMALFLLSQRASGLNGQAHLVDAGLTAAFPPLA